eukprot:SAG25_NODE_459_length_7828_cov_24.263907_2_plen_84_part_00
MVNAALLNAARTSSSLTSATPLNPTPWERARIQEGVQVPWLAMRIPGIVRWHGAAAPAWVKILANSVTYPKTAFLDSYIRSDE